MLDHQSALGETHHHTDTKNLFSADKSISMVMKKKDAWKNLPNFFSRYSEIVSSFLNILWEFLKEHSGISSDLLANRTLTQNAWRMFIINTTLQFSAGKVRWNFLVSGRNDSKYFLSVSPEKFLESISSTFVLLTIF